MTCVKKQIIKFLSDNKKKFSSSEICKNIENKGQGKTFESTVNSQLYRLYQNKTLNRKKINKTFHYFIGDNYENETSADEITESIIDDINVEEKIEKVNDEYKNTNYRSEYTQITGPIYKHFQKEKNEKIRHIENEINNKIENKRIEKFAGIIQKIPICNNFVELISILKNKKKEFNSDLKLKKYLFNLYIKSKLNPYKNKISKNNKGKKLYNLIIRYINFGKIQSNYEKLYNKLYCNNYPKIIFTDLDLKFLQGSIKIEKCVSDLEEKTHSKISHYAIYSEFDFYQQNNRHKLIEEPVRWSLNIKKNPKIEVNYINNRSFKFGESRNDLLKDTNEKWIIENIIYKRFKPTLKNGDVFCKNNITREFIYKHNNYEYLIYITDESEIFNDLQYVEFIVELIDIKV